MKKREALKAWADGHLLLVHNSNGDYEDDYFYMDDECNIHSLIDGEITEIDCFNNDDEFTIIPFHEYILKLNKV